MLHSDQIDLATVQVEASPAGVLSWPATAAITTLGIQPSALTLEVAPDRQWPLVPVDTGSEPSQAATLWVFLNIRGEWFGTGAERLRPGQLHGVKPESQDISSWIGQDWLFDVTRWKNMAGYTPSKGELVGWMVAAGSTPSDDHAPVHERTPVILVPWPGRDGSVWREGLRPGMPGTPSRPGRPDKPTAPNRPTAPTPGPGLPEVLHPYDASQVLTFIDETIAAFAAAGRTHALDAAVWIAQMQFDAVTLGYVAARAKQLAALRQALGLA